MQPEKQRRVPAMPIVENTPMRLVLKSGSTSLTLDKSAGKVTLQRKLLLWDRKPAEMALSEVTDATVDIAVDRASGVEVCHTMVIFRAGQGWAIQADDKNDAQATVAAVRKFLGFA
jgi:hypothetical protein